MGLCHSSSSALVREEGEGRTVYVVGDDDEGLPHDKHRRPTGGGIGNVASLYSKQGKKGPNQDSAIFCQGYGMDDGIFCGVFDGHGRHGHMISKLVRDTLPRLLVRHRKALLLAHDRGNNTDADTDYDDDVEGCLDSTSSPEVFDEWKEACISAFKAVDRELRRRDYLDCSYSGSTAVTVVKQGRDLIISNLGDSRAVLGTLDEDGRLMAVQLTTDLKPSVPRKFSRRSRPISRRNTVAARGIRPGLFRRSTKGVAAKRQLPRTRYGEGVRGLPAQEVRRDRRAPGVVPAH